MLFAPSITTSDAKRTESPAGVANTVLVRNASFASEKIAQKAMFNIIVTKPPF
jgi:hypothetical protein